MLAALKDAPATQWVPSLETGGTVGELRTGCHKNPIYLLGSQDIEVVSTTVYQQVRHDG